MKNWVGNYFEGSSSWVTRLECLKGAKHKVKRPEGPPDRSLGPEGPGNPVVYNFQIYGKDMCNLVFKSIQGCNKVSSHTTRRFKELVHFQNNVSDHSRIFP